MSTARDLFAAARNDAPDAAQRAAMFDRISSATVGAAAAASLAPGAATAATKSAAGTALTLKLVSVGVVLGAVMTGAIAVLTSSGPSGAAASVLPPATPRVADHAASRATLAPGVMRRRDPAQITTELDEDDDDDAPSAAAPVVAAPAAVATEAPSDLAEEARLVTAARRALMAGDPGRALVLVQTTRKLGARSLEPEELGLEARALRALGRADDAAATELVLKRRYPDSALAR